MTELIFASQEDRNKSFWEMVEPHLEQIRGGIYKSAVRSCNGTELDDVVAETLSSCCEHFGIVPDHPVKGMIFDAARGSLLTFIYMQSRRIARNLDWHNKLEVHLSDLVGDADPEKMMALSSHHHDDKGDPYLRQYLRMVLDLEFAPGVKAIEVVLRLQSGESMDEVGQVCGCSKAAVSRRMKNLRQRLVKLGYEAQE